MHKPLKLLIFMVAPLWLSFQPAFAHPVAYQGAFAVMIWNQPFLSDYWLTYSFRPDMALTARAMRMSMDQGGDFLAYLPQFDYLVKRWNGDDHQANIYVYGGYGGVRFQQRNGTAGLVGVEADAENRKLFVLARYEGLFPTIDRAFHHAEVRVGVAPYEAEYDQIASWFMIAGQYHPTLNKGYAVTPMARFFYKNALWETGVSLQGDWMLNLMFHF